MNGNYTGKNSLIYVFTLIKNTFAKKTDVPTKTSQITNDSDYINSSALTPYAKKTDIPTVPTNVGAFTNDKKYQTDTDVESAITAKGYQTSSQVETKITSKGYQTESQVQNAINSALSGITGIDFQVVSSLPTTGVKGVIYLVSNGGANPNAYDEYIYLTSSSKFEKIGTTDIDLSNYYNTSNFQEITNEEIDEIFSSI